MKSLKLLSLLAVCAGTSLATAAPRESFTFGAMTNIGRVGTVGNSVMTNTFAGSDGGGSYTALSVTVSGATALATSFGGESRFLITPPSGTAFVIQPFTVGTVASGTAFSTVGCPIDGTTAGVWSIESFDSYDDAGTDMNWTGVTLTLDDALPVVPALTGAAYSGIFANIPSDGTTTAGSGTVPDGARTVSITAPTGTTINKIMLSGFLTGLTHLDAGNTTTQHTIQARIRLTTPTAVNYTIQPFATTATSGTAMTNTTGGIAGGTNVGGLITVPITGIDSLGTWTFLCYETTNDAAQAAVGGSPAFGGVDSYWNVLKLGLANPPVNPVVSAPTCTPAVAASGTSRTLTATVAPAANPASATATVTANLTAFGGSATQAMLDDGVSPDAAIDGIYTYAGTLSAAPGGYNVAVTATAADARVGTGTIAVSLSNPTLSLGDLSVASSHTETVYSAAFDSEVRFFTFTAPAVSAAAGWVDIWTLPSGLADAQTDTELGLYDSAGNLVGLTSDDEGQGLFSLLTYGDTISRGLPGIDGNLRNGSNGALSNAVYYIAEGRYAVTFGATAFNATSAPGAAGQRSFKLVIDIGVPTAPTGPSVTAGAAAPANDLSGTVRTLTVTVTPGINHAGTAITGVASDLSSIGGPLSAAFLDDGVSPDAAIDGVYTWQGALTGPSGANVVSVTATDADAYTGSGNISVSFYVLPAAADIGKIAGSDNNPATADVYTGSFTQVAGGVNWVKFNIITAVQDDASAVTEGTWLDIDTETTGPDGLAVGSIGDTYIGMYRSDSTLIGADDDSGSYYRSQLTFGDVAPVRPGITAADTLDTGLAGDGSNGNLVVGTYYVAFANFASTMGATGFAATSTSTAAGTYVINFRTNLPVSPSATSPSVSGVTVARSTPGLLTSGSTVDVTATVAAGTSPNVALASVTADLTNIGGGAAVAMFDDGIAPDAAVDGVYTCSAVATGSVGPHTVTVTATDTIARSGNANGTCTIVAPPVCSLADIGVQGGNPGQDWLLDNNDFVVYITYFFALNPIADMGVQGGNPGQDTLFDNNDFVVFIGYFFTDQPACDGTP